MNAMTLELQPAGPLIANVMVDWFLKGGPVMWPLLLCLLAALFVVFDRVIWWGRPETARRRDQRRECLRLVQAGDLQGAFNLTETEGDAQLQVVRAGLLEMRSTFLGAMQVCAQGRIERAEKRMWVLGTLITLAPLLGLLGTVTGIMHSFNFVGQEDLAAVKVSGGIAEALIATAGGLGVAIIALLPYNYFNRRIRTLRIRLERAINEFEIRVETARSHGCPVGEFVPAQFTNNRRSPVSDSEN